MNTDITKPTHGEAVKAGMKAKAMAGVPTGPVPLGYRKVRRDGIVTVEIDEEVAPLVREAFRLAALKRQSVRKILTVLNEQGIVSKNGKALSATALWRILTNRFYCGLLLFDNQEFPGTHTSLVSYADFSRVQKNLSKRRRH